MPVTTFTDRKGRQYEWDGYHGHGWFRAVTKRVLPHGWEARMKDVKSLEIRNDDIMICSFPKAGAHWIWEIVSMVTHGTAEYDIVTTEPGLFLEAPSSRAIESAASPRILNSHYAVSCLPEQIFTKKIKIIHAMRNPKDAATLYFYHAKSLLGAFGDNEKPFETFSEYLPYITGEYGVHLFVSTWRYLKEFKKFTQDNPDQVLTLWFEDMLKNPAETVRKVSHFLNKNLSEELIKTIAENISFKELKAAYTTTKPPENTKRFEELANGKSDRDTSAYVSDIYRKGVPLQHRYPELKEAAVTGQIGDWKYHFTVAENEQFDMILHEEFKDSDMSFEYSA